MKHILIIEDDTAILELERDYLEAYDYQVDTATDGAVGLGMARRIPYDLILLDVMLPGMDGFTLCRTLREEQNTPILLVSARKDEVDKIRGLGLGANDYICKPFNPSELVARVKAHIANFQRLTGKAENSRVICCRDLVLDLDARRVTRGGREVPLANKEFDLLAFLMQNPGIVFRKETLFDRIWGMDAYGETSTVTVHVGRLREKLEEGPGETGYIETVWGAGYRFREEDRAKEG